jgi:uncharacterized protein
LLHDVGHGPFSHAFEKVTGIDHETKTSEIICDSGTEINKVLAEQDPRLPGAICDLLKKSSVGGKSTVPSYYQSVVSSQLDADRFDYLLRDCHATGVGYGDFDHRYLISHLYVDEDNGRIYLSHKALFAAEAYVFARYHMYRIVYFHKTTRAAEVMFRLFLKRYRELVMLGSDTTDGVLSTVPRYVRNAFESNKISLSDYQNLDDHSITGLLKICSNGKDVILSELSRGLLNRRYYKCREPLPDRATFKRIEASIEAKGRSVEYCLEEDKPSDAPYKPYDPDEDPKTIIWIENENGKQADLSRISDPVGELTEKYSLQRLYFPSDLRDDIEEKAKVL